VVAIPLFHFCDDCAAELQRLVGLMTSPNANDRLDDRIPGGHSPRRNEKKACRMIRHATRYARGLLSPPNSDGADFVPWELRERGDAGSTPQTMHEVIIRPNKIKVSQIYPKCD